MKGIAAPSLVLVLLVGLSGCAAHTDGPVQLDGGEAGDRTVNCMPLASNHDFALGFNVLKNSGQVPVEITGVSANKLDGLVLLGSYVAPITEMTVFDTATRWPVSPARLDDKVRADWARHQEAIGPGRLVPFGPNSAWSLILHLRVTGPKPSLESVTVTYRVNGKDYATTGNSALKLEAVCT